MPRTTIRSEDVTDAQIKTADMAVDPTNASNLSSGSVPTAQLGNVDTSGLEADIALLAFKTQSNGNLARYNLVDQSVDDFQDSSGVNAGTSTGELRNVPGRYYQGASAANYFGSGADGNVTIASNTNLVVPNKNGSYDGDVVVKNYADLTINATVTLTTDQPCRGMLLYCTGNLVVNGTISMTARGALANPTASGGSDSSAVSATGWRLPIVKSGGTETLAAADFAGGGTGVVAAVANQPATSGNGVTYTWGRAGAAGATGNNTNGNAPSGTAGGSVSGGITSGGGGSGGGHNSGGYSGTGGNGAAGTIFSGGPGGGGAGDASTANPGVANGGAGGAATQFGSTGGAGNPAGAGAGGTPVTAPASDGTGGLLIIIVQGNVTVDANGSIQSKGSSGGTAGAGNYKESGGSSGGGSVVILHGGTLSNSGEISAAGGISGGGWSGYLGGAGGAGGSLQDTINTTTPQNMTLISNAQTAAQATDPTKADIVMTYSNGAGTAVVNTDLIASVSRDGGTNYTAATLATQGTTAGHTILTASDIDISGQPAGKSMVWKIATTDQGPAAKNTRIHAVSLGWS